MTKVLIVDDDLASIEVMPKILRSPRYQVVTAQSGEEALRLIKDHGESISLMLLDVSLLDMGGFAVASRAEKVIPKAKMIYVSGYPAEEGLRSRWIHSSSYLGCKI